MIVTSTPRSSKSIRRLSKNEDKEALLAQYAADLRKPRYAERLEIATSCPSPRLSISGKTAATLLTAPITLTLRTLATSSGSRSGASVVAPTPALAIITSTRPKASRKRSAAALTCLKSRTSADSRIVWGRLDDLLISASRSISSATACNRGEATLRNDSLVVNE